MILFYSAQNLFKSVVMFLIMAVGGLIRILKNVVGGTCLGFAPRSESFAIEPLVQVCSISSLSGLALRRPSANPLNPHKTD